MSSYRRLLAPAVAAAAFLALTLVLAACSDDNKNDSGGNDDSTPGASSATNTPSASNGGTPVGSFADNCQQTGETQFPAAPPQIIDASKSYSATISTDKGDIAVELDTGPTVTTNNFIFLACKGYYDGLVFHRVEDWVIQGGDPTGTGSGGPGYSIPAEFDGAVFDEAVIGMARSQDPNSAGSQFFITTKPANYLDGQYAAFGSVTSGMEVAKQIAIGDAINSITIEES